MPFNFSGEVPTFGGDNANPFKASTPAPATATESVASAQLFSGTTSLSGALSATDYRSLVPTASKQITPAVSYDSNHDIAEIDCWKSPLADIVYRVSKACEIECGAVTELEREHVQDRVGIMGAYLRDPMHKAGSGELMAMGKDLLERVVDAVKGGQGSLAGKLVDAVELRFNPSQRV